jgi:hypothetical protein
MEQDTSESLQMRSIFSSLIKIKVTVKLSLYRTIVAQRVPGS